MLQFAEGQDIYWWADSMNKRVQMLDDKFTHIKDVKHTKMKTPTHVAVNSRGLIFVSDCGRNEVFVFSHTGEFMRRLSGVSWETPLGVALDGEDNIYVCNSRRQSIEVFDKDCNYVRAFGRYGTEPGQFSSEPQCIAALGNMIIVSDATARLYQFNTSGTFITDYSHGKVGDVGGLECGPNGCLLIVDKNAAILAVTLKDDRILRSIGTCGEEPWQLRKPNGVAFSPYGQVIVANTHNHNILVYNLDKTIYIQ